MTLREDSAACQFLQLRVDFADCGAADQSESECIFFRFGTGTLCSNCPTLKTVNRCPYKTIKFYIHVEEAYALV